MQHTIHLEVLEADNTDTLPTADYDVYEDNLQSLLAIHGGLIVIWCKTKVRKHKIYVAFITLLLIGLAVTLSIVISTKVDTSKHKTDECTDPGAHTRATTRVTIELYGVLQDGRDVTRYTLNNDHMQVSITNYGGIITAIQVPDKDGKMDDVVLGFDRLQDYIGHKVLMGAIVGRYANLIAGDRFRLDGVDYVLNNDDVGVKGSSRRGFSKRLWDSRIERGTLVLTYNSPDGEGGFPGNVNASVTYDLTEDDELIITYKAATTKPTVINLTNRSFFNLNGHASGDLNDHTVSIAAERYTPLDTEQVPTGVKASVYGTKYDVRANIPLRRLLPYIPGGRGFDINYAFDREGWDKHMARVMNLKNGRVIDVYSTEPGLHFNTGYYLQGIMGKEGVVYKQDGGFSLEAQHYPNSPNEPRFPTTIVRPGKPYTQTTKYVFGIEI